MVQILAQHKQERLFTSVFLFFNEPLLHALHKLNSKRTSPGAHRQPSFVLAGSRGRASSVMGVRASTLARSSSITSSMDLLLAASASNNSCSKTHFGQSPYNSLTSPKVLYNKPSKPMCKSPLTMSSTILLQPASASDCCCWKVRP